MAEVTLVVGSTYQYMGKRGVYLFKKGHPLTIPDTEARKLLSKTTEYGTPIFGIEFEINFKYQNRDRNLLVVQKEFNKWL